jgi:hypothetical protein
MAGILNDYSGVSAQQKMQVLSFLHDSEVNEVAADLSQLEFHYMRDVATTDIRVVIRNRKSGKSFSKVIPDYMLNNTSGAPQANPALQTAFINTTVAAQSNVNSNSYNSYNVIASNTGVSIGSISQTGSSTIAADEITVKGKSLLTFMEKIEERLAILVPNPELEKEYVELAELRRQYDEKEKYILAQKKTIELLTRDGVKHK